ncbi:MAG: hypothetical protein IPQ08_06325 [Chitinophagaceae bacterium]|nr:hypothetical protein [Chitinophagaceae bacterium]
MNFDQQEFIRHVEVLIDGFMPSPTLNTSEPIPDFESIGPSQSDLDEMNKTLPLDDATASQLKKIKNYALKEPK